MILLQELEKNNKALLREEYNIIGYYSPKHPDRPSEAAKLHINNKKNRYGNIHPCKYNYLINYDNCSNAYHLLN